MRKYWELIILLLSIYTFGVVSVEIIYPFDENSVNMINQIDLYICMIFLSDFFYFLIKSDNKTNYIKRNWLDFVSSLPMLNILRTLRIVRIMRFVRVIKLFRGVKGIIPIINYFNKNKSQGILFAYTGILIIVLFYCSLIFYVFEKEVNEGINMFFDAVWLSFITTTSVGYGDIYPVTIEGRITAMVLTLMGMGLFSIITAEIATKFLSYLKHDNKN